MFLHLFTFNGAMLVNRSHIISATESKINDNHTTLRMANGDEIEVSTEYKKFITFINHDDCL